MSTDAPNPSPEDASAGPRRRARSPFEDLRRTVMGRLRDLGFKTTGGVARLMADGACGVIEIQKSGRSNAEADVFTVHVGIALGPLLAKTTKKPLGHCSTMECHARLRIGDLGEPRRDVWWSLAAGAPDAAVTEEVWGRIEADAVPFLRRYTAGGALVACWESGQPLGVTERQRADYLRWLTAGDGPR